MTAPRRNTSPAPSGPPFGVTPGEPPRGLHLECVTFTDNQGEQATYECTSDGDIIERAENPRFGGQTSGNVVLNFTDGTTLEVPIGFWYMVEVELGLLEFVAHLPQIDAAMLLRLVGSLQDPTDVDAFTIAWDRLVAHLHGCNSPAPLFHHGPFEHVVRHGPVTATLLWDGSRSNTHYTLAVVTSDGFADTMQYAGVTAIQLITPVAGIKPFLQRLINDIATNAGASLPLDRVIIQAVWRCP